MANPIGEDSWLAYIEEQRRHVADLEARVKVVELFKAALGDEPSSLRLWLAYCEYFWSLFAECQSPASAPVSTSTSSSSSASSSAWPSASPWTDEERQLGRDLFSFDAALSLWSDGYNATKFRIADSHLFWDRWVAIELEQLARTRTPSGVKRISHLFRDRLQVPHTTWDQTSQMFSEFLTTYNNAAYEHEFQDVTRTARDAKAAYELRESHELDLARAQRAEDREAEKTAMRQYLDWEMAQTTLAYHHHEQQQQQQHHQHQRQQQQQQQQHHDPFALPLGLGLYARALTGLFAFDDDIWNNCAVYLSSVHRQIKTYPSLYTPLPNMLDFFKRATKHCPSSGPLWSRYILTAEDAGWSFHNVESIKHAATNTKALDKNGMTSVLDMYTAWCGFLKRTAMDPNAPEDAADVAEVGLLAALEDVDLWGKRLYKDAYQGDPNFRLERILIQFLTEVKGDVDAARNHWDRMAHQSLLANSYDFWLNYYLWEMVIYASRPKAPSPTPPTPSMSAKTARTPALATGVLQRALTQKTLDWPERVMEVYLQHCNDYEQPDALHYALDAVHKTRRVVAKRRARENAAAAAYTTQPETETGAGTETNHTQMNVVVHSAQEATAPGSPSSGKRKRDETGEVAGEAGETASKRAKSTETHTGETDAQGSKLKRDRENTSVMVTNLPPDVTQTAIRRYFKEYGHINNLILCKEADNKSSSALIEFRSSEDADSAVLRDQKYFHQSQLSVKLGIRLTLFVSNYPPTADEAYIRRLFQECGDVFNIRWPSLKYNTHRRFCYVSFRSSDAAYKATLMDGTMLEGKYKLQAKFSDPSHKKDREGALAEGRELRVKGVHPATQENDLRSIFGKYGKVVTIRLLTNLSGHHVGTAFVVFETKEQAENALQLDKTKFKSQLLEVELCKDTNFRPLATSKGDHDSATSSPAPSGDGDIAMIDEPGDKKQNEHTPTPSEIQERTMAILDVPDTVNSSRIRALAETHGSIIKVVLRPDHAGAIVEFTDASAAGRAALGLEGFEITPGHKLRTGSVKELFKEKGEQQQQQQQQAADTPKAPPKPWMPPPPAVRRPVLGRGGTRRGGIGFVAVAKKEKESGPK
ncbi:putative pre-mRNA splicing factor [Hypoxylon argillaceum]|nr:putative pre-mRNA splicing factor [Hypoxylon argillaceum]